MRDAGTREQHRLGSSVTPALYHSHPTATRRAVLLMGHLIQPNIALPCHDGWRVANKHPISAYAKC